MSRPMWRSTRLINDLGQLNGLIKACARLTLTCQPTQPTNKDWVKALPLKPIVAKHMS